jgi:hypothetical protein
MILENHYIDAIIHHIDVSIVDIAVMNHHNDANNHHVVVMVHDVDVMDNDTERCMVTSMRSIITKPSWIMTTMSCSTTSL